MVFQLSLNILLLQKNNNNYHLYFIKKIISQYINIVKVYRVFPSTHNNSASSQKIQFHKVYSGDSRTVITPFMQDTN